MTEIRFRLATPADDTVVRDERHAKELSFQLAWAGVIPEMVMTVSDEKRAETLEALALIGAQVV